MTDARDAVVAAQDAHHAEGHDYDKGSPHLRHDNLRGMVERRLGALVRERIAATGACRVLEVGGGHGTFTRCLLDAGAQVTVTEVSRASAAALEASFGDRIEVRYDATGEEILASEDRWDLAVMTAVLHHIPDYLAFLDRLAGLIAPGGAIFTVADPMWYPRMPKLVHGAQRASYFSWRLLQGSYVRGLKTRWRRLRGVYVETEESDVVEYHVWRQGCDEEAIRDLLATRFGTVEVFPYWATQAPLLQRLGDKTSMVCDFGVQATGRRP